MFLFVVEMVNVKVTKCATNDALSRDVISWHMSREGVLLCPVQPWGKFEWYYETQICDYVETLRAGKKNVDLNQVHYYLTSYGWKADRCEKPIQYL